MLRLNYGNLFQDWELGIARELVDKFKKKYNCLKNEDFEDLLQECLAEWVFAKTKYDPTYKVPPKTHMGRIVRNVLINIIRKKKTDKRKLEYLSDSLDRPFEDTEDSPTLMDTISDCKNDVLDIRLKSELNVKLPHALQKLTPEQTKLYRLIVEEGLTINQASKYFSSPRTHIYDEIKRLRGVLRKEGIEKFLKNFRQIRKNYE